jgi:hypothetical protein
MENQLDGGAWTELLSSKYFGSSDPFTGRILDGRWESSPVPLMDDSFFDAHGIDKERTFFPDEETYWYVLVLVLVLLVAFFLYRAVKELCLILMTADDWLFT